MELSIITPDKSLFSGDADAVKLPGTDGSFGVLDHHAPLIATLREGRIKVTKGNETEYFEIGSGVVEVLNNKVIILAEQA